MRWGALHSGHRPSISRCELTEKRPGWRGTPTTLPGLCFSPVINSLHRGGSGAAPLSQSSLFNQVGLRQFKLSQDCTSLTDGDDLLCFGTEVNRQCGKRKLSFSKQPKPDETIGSGLRIRNVKSLGKVRHSLVSDVGNADGTGSNFFFRHKSGVITEEGCVPAREAQAGADVSEGFNQLGSDLIGMDVRIPRGVADNQSGEDREVYRARDGNVFLFHRFLFDTSVLRCHTC
jgi:hypothetical protein